MLDAMKESISWYRPKRKKKLLDLNVFSAETSRRHGRAWKTQSRENRAPE